MKVTYEMTGDPTIPAIVHRGDHSTPVWLQQCWEDGEFAVYIRNNGCGHCCIAMAANLHGVKITPYEEYLHCRELWGPPTGPQHHFMSLPGIQKVLASFEIPSEIYGVKTGEGAKAAAHIMQALREEKLVIMVSEPSDRLPNNPFSTGLHYVLCVGLTDDGKIIIANSSKRATDKGVQVETEATVAAAIYENCEPGGGMTWGELERFFYGCGYVVIG